MGVMCHAIPQEERNYNPTFSQWLYFKRESRGTAEGRVARFIYADKTHDGSDCWPHRANTITYLVGHLRRHHGRDPSAPNEAELRALFVRYREFVAAGGYVPIRTGGIEPKSNALHRGYLILPETVAAIKLLSLERNVTQGQLLDAVIAEEAARAERRRGKGK